MAGEWVNALMRSPDPGTSFTNAFNQARERKQRDEMMQMQMQEHQEDRQLRRDTMEAQKHKAVLDQNREKILMGAKIIRQVKPQDDAGWQQVRAIAGQAGIDLSDVPPTFNPQYVQGIISYADAMDPVKESQGPASVQEYEYAKQQGFGGSYMDFVETKQGPIIANNGDGTFQLIPRAMARQGAPQGAAPPPPPPGFVLDNDGGQTGSAPSGGFPR